MGFTLETRTGLEIHMEVLLLASRDLRMTGCWPKWEPIFAVDQLPGAHGLDLNWRIALPYGCDDELAKVLQDAAATVQVKWRLQLPFLGSSAIAG